MSDGAFSIIEMVFVGGVTLGFLFWQLISVRRSIRADRAAEQNKDKI